MGGSSYDRDVYSGSSYDNWGTSDYSATRFTRHTIDSDLNPVGKKVVSQSKHPIVIVLDVTGSNINFARLVYDKLPMFYGNIEQKGYVKDFDICICAVGDAKYDNYPIQIGTPAKGIEIDSWLEKIVLESGGGGNEYESYEVMAHYLANNTEFREDAEPVLFFIGDEATSEIVSRRECERVGIECAEDYNPWPELRKKFKDNVYVMLNKYCGDNFNERFTKTWQKVMPPEHTIKIPEEKAIVDLMLGVLALQKEDLDVYAIDMGLRGQTTKRIEGVTEALKELASTTAISTNVSTALPSNPSLKLTKKGKRI